MLIPSWNEIFDSVQSNNAIENQKKLFFKKLIEHTGRNCIVYFSCWQQKPGTQSPFSIEDDDRNGFMNALYGLDKTKGLDLILHTPGGDSAATQSIVDYLFSYFNGDVRVIVPHTAMSAGTMIACSAKEIIMGKHSNLGPIDPQISGMPAHEFVNLLNQAISDISANKNVVYWQMTLSKYPPTLFGLCNNAIAVSKKNVKKWLERTMLKDTDSADVDKTVEYLANYNFHLQHNTRLSIDELKKNTSLKITALEEDQELQESVLSLYHCYQIYAAGSNCAKIVENHKSIKFIKNHAPN